MHGLYFIALVALALFCGVGLPFLFAKAEEQRERERRESVGNDERTLRRK